MLSQRPSFDKRHVRPVLRVAAFTENERVLRGIAAQRVIEDVPVVHLLAFCHLALLGITRVIEAAVIGLPRDAGRARAFDGVGQQLVRGGLDDVQRAHLGAALGGAVRDILAVVRGLPPVERHRAVLGKLVGVHQHFVFAVHAFADVENRLVLLAFTAGVEVILAAHLRLAQVADFEQLLDAVVQLVAAGQLVEDAARVGQLRRRPTAASRGCCHPPASGTGRQSLWPK